jgi:hypothetical protein
VSEVYYSRSHLLDDEVSSNPELVAIAMKETFGSVVDAVVRAGLNPLDGALRVDVNWLIDHPGYVVDCQWRPDE